MLAVGSSDRDDGAENLESERRDDLGEIPCHAGFRYSFHARNSSLLPSSEEMLDLNLGTGLQCHVAIKPGKIITHG